MSTLDRRRFIGSALTFSAVSGVSSSGVVMAAAQVVQARQQAVVMYRKQNVAASAFAHQLEEAGLQVLALQDDIVRQWRDGLEQTLLSDKKLLLGMGHWSDYIQLQGLAAEVRHHPLLTMQHAASGSIQENWSEQHADEILALTRLSAFADVKDSLQTLQNRPGLTETAPALFSWVIG